MGVFGYLAESGYLAPLLPTVAWVSIGAAIAYGCIFLFNLFRAPYKQRNEALALLQKQPMVPPLTNRTALLEAIAELKSSALNFMNYRVGQATPAFFEANRRYIRSIDELEAQKLVAGNAYKSPINDLVILVMLPMLMKLQESGINNITDKVKMDIKLQQQVDYAIRKIDEISGQVPGKEGSQTE